MTGSLLRSTAHRALPDRTTALLLSVLLVLETLLAVRYAARPSITITDPLVLVYPFVWIDVSILAIRATDPPRTTRRRRSLGIVVAGAYFLVLAYFGGLLGAGSGSVPLHVNWTLPPGYGPALLYDGSILRVVLEPYTVIGYLALTYLVYVTVLDAVGRTLSGVIGLFSCVSCSWPLLGTVATSVFGGTSALAALALGHAYGLSTVVFLSAILLLRWRPTH